MNNRLRTLVIAVTIAGVGIFGLYIYRTTVSHGFDSRLTAAIAAVQGLHTYEMSDSTFATVQDRSIGIEGTYRLDFDSRRYASESTTTLTMLDGKTRLKSHAFSLEHRSINDDIYIKILTESALLQKTIPYGPNWRHFKSTAIPERFVDIAVAGPILDNLSLFGKNGSYLSLEGRPVDVTEASSTYHMYTFSLSKQISEVTTGPLKGLIDLIATGTILVWIDDMPAIRRISITGPSYQSTTTILRVNTPLTIEAPTVVE